MTIHNRSFKQQIVDFGKLTATDIDAFMDYKNKLFVIAETKFDGAPMHRGQEIALERLCDACHNPPKRLAVAFITKHHSEGDIDLSKTLVTKYRWNGKWRYPKKTNELFDCVEYLKGMVK